MQVSTLGKRNPGTGAAPPPRKPSPPRNSEEVTFQQKLDEIKKMRMCGELVQNAPREQTDNGVKPKNTDNKKVLTVHGYKTFLKSFGDWSEVVSKSGKVYFYNKKTLVNQWKKPTQWLVEEEKLNEPPPLPPPLYQPPLPPPPFQPSLPPQPPEPQGESEEAKDKVGFKLKIKGKKKVKKRVKNPEGHLPLAYQKNAPKRLDSDSDEDEESKKAKSELTIENAFEDPDDNEQRAKLSKLDPKDENKEAIPSVNADGDDSKTETTSSTVEERVEEAANKANPVSVKKEGQRFVPNVSGPRRAENLFEGSAAALAFANITKLPGATLYGENPLPPPAALNLTSNPTYFTEYNLPCCLKRCKFPKQQDVLHELKLNKQKRRNFVPPPLPSNLASAFAHLGEEVQFEQFYTELKNPNNRDTLLTSKMKDAMVYKIPEEVWDRYFTLFQVKIFDGVFLECKPAGYTDNDEIVYSRTGKICGHKTFPEDEVRCQAVLQAWKKSYCLCVYANRTFTVKRDDDDWDDILYETEKFLEKSGY